MLAIAMLGCFLCGQSKITLNKQPHEETLLGAAAITLLATACKKSDDNGTPSNTWKVGSDSYTSLSITGTGGGTSYIVSAATGTGTSTNAITFYFSGGSVPAAGTYKVVSSATAANQVSFTAAGGSASSATSYQSTGNDNVSATVSVNNKVSISMPDASAKKTGGTDSLKVSANITVN